jgi:hypothetical protein
LRGVGEEGPSILGTKFSGTREPQKRLVHEAGRVEKGVAPSMPQPRPRQTMELRIGCGKQGIPCLSVTALYPPEEIGELRHRVSRHRAESGDAKDSVFT